MARMELRHLLALDAVLTTGSFTAAAASRHLSQPALWAQVKELEAELGLALFVRAGRGVTPTAACEALRPQLELALGDVAELCRLAMEIREGWEAPARIGCASAHVSAFLADCIRGLRDREPRTPFPVIVSVTTSSAIEALERGSVDLVVEPRAKPALLESAQLYPMHVVAVGPVVGDAEQLELSRLDAVPVATLPATSLVRRMLQDAARTSGLKLRVVYESRDAHALLALAERGLCTAILQDEMITHAPALRAARITSGGLPIASPIWLSWRPEPTLAPAARALRDIMIERAEALRDARKSEETK